MLIDPGELYRSKAFFYAGLRVRNHTLRHFLPTPYLCHTPQCKSRVRFEIYKAFHDQIALLNQHMIVWIIRVLSILQIYQKDPTAGQLLF